MNDFVGEAETYVEAELIAKNYSNTHRTKLITILLDYRTSKFKIYCDLEEKYMAYLNE
jgi:hypothetical protein